MNDIEKEFFEEFKHLEKLCCDMFCEAHGVKEYYLTMESNHSIGRYSVSGWDNDYRMLKRINYLRNKIAHDTGITDCTVDDINFVTEFFQRIIDGKDPLAQLRLFKESNQRIYKVKEDPARNKIDVPAIKPQPARYSDYKPHYKSSKGDAVSRVKTFVLILVIIALVLLGVYLLKK